MLTSKSGGMHHDVVVLRIGFHPLHTWPAIAVYAGLTVPKKTRWFGIGLLIHIVLDGMDCLLM